MSLNRKFEKGNLTVWGKPRCIFPRNFRKSRGRCKPIIICNFVASSWYFRGSLFVEEGLDSRSFNRNFKLKRLKDFGLDVLRV